MVPPGRGARVIQAVMGLWAVGLVVIAVCWPMRLVQAAIVCSVFGGAAIAKLGGLAVSPYYFTLMLIAARCAILPVTGKDLFGRVDAVRRAMRCAAVLLVIGLGSAFVLPRVFTGLGVLSPRLDADYEAPLAFSNSNLGQAVYLLLNVMLLWYAAQTCRTADTARGVVRAFYLAGVIVIGVAAYQLLSSLTGLPFPDALLYSNDSFVMQAGTAILDMPRICATYTEPAGLASFLVPLILLVAGMAELPSSGWRETALLIAAIAFCILSTSSTAYLGLAGIAAWAVCRYVFLPAMRGRGNAKAATAVLVLIVAAVVTVAASSQLQEVLRVMVFEKNQTSSYEQRSFADGHSMALAKTTYGLGVGLGSNRASSFLPSMLSTIGIYGLMALAVLVFLLVRRPRSASPVLALQGPLSASLFGAFGVLLVAGPDLSIPTIWVGMAALVAVLAATETSTAADTELAVEASPPRVAFSGVRVGLGDDTGVLAGHAQQQLGLGNRRLIFSVGRGRAGELLAQTGALRRLPLDLGVGGSEASG